jgi:hypothetical protein
LIEIKEPKNDFKIIITNKKVKKTMGEYRTSNECIEGAEAAKGEKVVFPLTIIIGGPQ